LWGSGTGIGCCVRDGNVGLMGWITYLVGVLLSCCASVVMWWLLESGNGEEKRAYLYSSSRKAFQSETIGDVL
jgi:hypothetical protein